MLTPQNSELYLAALLQDAGLEQGEALRVARRAHDLGLGRTASQQRTILENEAKSIQVKAAANVAAITHVVVDHYSDVSADPEGSVPPDMSYLELRREIRKLKDSFSDS